MIEVGSYWKCILRARPEIVKIKDISDMNIIISSNYYQFTGFIAINVDIFLYLYEPLTSLEMELL